MTPFPANLIEAVRIGTGFLMEQLFAALEIVPEVVGGQSAAEQEYFAVDYTLWLNLAAIGLSGFLYWRYRQGRGPLSPVPGPGVRHVGGRGRPAGNP